MFESLSQKIIPFSAGVSALFAANVIIILFRLSLFFMYYRKEREGVKTPLSFLKIPNIIYWFSFIILTGLSSLFFLNLLFSGSTVDIARIITAVIFFVMNVIISLVVRNILPGQCPLSKESDPRAIECQITFLFYGIILYAGHLSIMLEGLRNNTFAEVFINFIILFSFYFAALTFVYLTWGALINFLFIPAVKILAYPLAFIALTFTYFTNRKDIICFNEIEEGRGIKCLRMNTRRDIFFTNVKNFSKIIKSIKWNYFNGGLTNIDEIGKDDRVNNFANICKHCYKPLPKEHVTSCLTVIFGDVAYNGDNREAVLRDPDFSGREVPLDFRELYIDLDTAEHRLLTVFVTFITNHEPRWKMKGVTVSFYGKGKNLPAGLRNLIDNNIAVLPV
ncbi:MAG: hypothetical protein JW969_17600 [Spirochaetales bacterium]|nr:hypothetical protein [Spirochaetales bacterium]